MVDGSLFFETSVDTKGFEKGTRQVDNCISGISKSLKSLAKVAAAAFSVKMISDFAKASKEAYNVQLEAETKLATIMKQRMNASDDVIQSVKELATEQQRLGVIGDEVQLAGAQQVATFLNEAETLKTLLPAMNDLLAQQSGLNASTGDAVNIANLMGKVLQGQTSALKRVGISFSEAEEQVLKYGSESERAAMLAQVITNNVGHMNAALAKTDAGKQKQLANTMGDVKEQFGQAVTQIESVFLPVVQTLANVLSRVASIAREVGTAIRAAFGVDSDTNSATIAAATASSAAATASAYEDIADEAERAQEAQDGTLASFDKIIKLDEGSGSSDTATGAGSGGAVTPITFDTSVAENGISKLGESLKKRLGEVVDFIDREFGDSFAGIWDGFLKESGKLKKTFGRVFSDIKKLGAPLKKYFKNDLVPQFRTIFETCGHMAVGLLDTFNLVFADIWDLAVYPLLRDLITLGLPMLSQFSTKCWELTGTLFDQIKAGFDTLWIDVMQPVLMGISGLVSDVLQSLYDFWQTWGAPIFDDAKEAIETTGELIGELWDKWIKPVWDNIVEVTTALWKDHLKPLLDNILDFIGELIDGALRIYNKFIAPIISWVVDKLAPIITSTFNNIVNNLGRHFGAISDLINGLITTLKGIVQFIVGVFTGDWRKAWEGIKNIFKGIWDTFVTIVKTPINLIIGLINGMTGAIEKAVNWIIDKLNYLSFDVPDWIPGIGGSHFGFDLKHIDIPDIPYLAKGTVVPANYGEFAAILGDNKREPEVVSPISAMKQAFVEAMSEHGSGRQPIVLNLTLDTRRGRKLLSQQIIDDINDIINSTGNVPINL